MRFPAAGTLSRDAYSASDRECAKEPLPIYGDGMQERDSCS
jgi:hypothetical protein